MTFVEVLVALLLTTFVVFVCMRLTTAAYKVTGHNHDRQFATQKAISMIEELKSIVQTQGNPVSMLDAYDDGGAYQTVLTSDKSITNPAATGSGNINLGGSGWKYTRQITVAMVTGSVDDSVRMVNVKVCMNKDEDRDGKPDILGEVASVIRTTGGVYPPTQVFDIYAVAIENVPGWWVHMRTLIPFVQSAVQDLQSRNPGLEMRVHWITKLSYGRDQYYRPYINDTQDSTQHIDYVYFYPGLMPTGSAIDYYYPTDNFKAQMLVDATPTNAYDATTNPLAYTLADNFNHAMRYPDELALFTLRVGAGLETDDTPTLRILLERMYQNPFAYRNSIFINLHGELMPFPPIRNFSDAAKEPEGYRNIRAVTHPEFLHYPNNTPSVKLRVYSYRTDPLTLPAVGTAGAVNVDWLGENNPSGPAPITVKLKGIAWTPSPGDIRALRGGTNQDGAPGFDAYAWFSPTTTASATDMYYTATTTGGDTVLKLFNSPLRAPELLVSGSNYAGLNTNEWLYGLEYIPSPLENLAASSLPSPIPFATDLTAAHQKTGSACTSGNCDKNTARWTITIPPSAFPAGATGNEMLTFETRIDSTTSGIRTDELPNISRTYCWKGTDLWMFGDGTSTNLPHLPITEQYQILGDPRHLPYADLKEPHQGSGLPLQNKLGMGYNRYFDDFQNAAANKGGATNWPGWYYTVGGQQYGIKNDASTTNDGWETSNSSLEVDVHRVYQTLRTALVSTHSVFTTMTGWSFYYLGMGDEIGYDASNGFNNSIPISRKPYDGTTGSTNEQSILEGGACTSGALFGYGVEYVRDNAAGNYWWGINWLGELYPDSAYLGATGWKATGNLPSGTTANAFRRTLRGNINVNLPAGTTLNNGGRMTQPEGSTAFYWSGTATSTFHHNGTNGTGDLMTDGTEISNNYNYPLSDGIPINRPFNININNTADNPDHFLQTAYGPALTSARLASYYDQSSSSSVLGSALLTFSDANNNAEFVAVNGISMVGTSGSSFQAGYSMLTLVHSFFAGGRYNAGGAGHIEQVPRVVLTSPNYTTNLVDPATIPITWSRTWFRWDGLKYTTAYAAGYAETSALSYAVLYSADNGANWKYMQDNSVAIPGQRPANAALRISSGAASTSYTWSTPAASFPEGTYLVRVECYRDLIPLHYAYHQYRAVIRRTT